MHLPPYVSVKEEIHEYFRENGTVLTADIDAETIDQIYEDHQRLQTLQFPDYGTAYNFYIGEKSTWRSLFGNNSLEDFPGTDPGKRSKRPISPPEAIARRQAAKMELVTCPECETKFRFAPKAPRRPQPRPRSPDDEYQADQPPIQQLDCSVLVGSLA